LVSNPGDSVSEVVQLLFYQRGKKPKSKTNRKNKQKTKPKPNKNPKLKWNLNPSASNSSSVIVSSKEEKKTKKKESGDSFVNVYLRLQLICPLLAASCCWRLY
jgi:hypothetical protein